MSHRACTAVAFLALLAGCDAQQVAPLEPACVRADGWEFLGLEGPPERYLSAIVVDPENPDHILAGTRFPGLIYRSEDGGLTWDSTDGRGGVRWLFFDRGMPARVFVATTVNVQRSDDAGQTWEVVLDGHVGYAPFYNVAQAADGMLYAATADAWWPNTFHRSDDGGDSWDERELLWQPTRLVPHPDRPEVLYLALSWIGDLMVSRDRGQTWTATAYEGSLIQDLIFDTADHRVLYASAWDGLWRSEDRGETWASYGEGLPEGASGGIVQDPESGTLYVLVRYEEDGVYRTGLWGRERGARVWEDVSAPDLSHLGGLYVTEERMLYVGSNGLWRLDLKTATAVEPGPCGP